VNLWNGGGYTGETWVRNDWVPLFQQYSVDAVINGHAHNYNRGMSNGVTYLIVGGGGGSLDTERVAYWPVFTVEYSLHHCGIMNVQGYTLHWEAVSNTGQVLDTFSLSSRIPRLGWDSATPVPGTLPLTITGKPGVSYILEQSSDLSAWSPLATNTIPLGGPITVTNPVPTTAGHSFIRARASSTK